MKAYCCGCKASVNFLCMLDLTGLPSASAAATAPLRRLLPDALVSSGALSTTDSSGTDSLRVSSVTCTVVKALVERRGHSAYRGSNLSVDDTLGAQQLAVLGGRTLPARMQGHRCMQVTEA